MCTPAGVERLSGALAQTGAGGQSGLTQSLTPGLPPDSAGLPGGRGSVPGAVPPFSLGPWRDCVSTGTPGWLGQPRGTCGLFPPARCALASIPAQHPRQPSTPMSGGTLGPGCLHVSSALCPHSAHTALAAQPSLCSPKTWPCHPAFVGTNPCPIVPLPLSFERPPNSLLPSSSCWVPARRPPSSTLYPSRCPPPPHPDPRALWAMDAPHPHRDTPAGLWAGLGSLQPARPDQLAQSPAPHGCPLPADTGMPGSLSGSDRCLAPRPHLSRLHWVLPKNTRSPFHLFGSRAFADVIKMRSPGVGPRSACLVSSKERRKDDAHDDEADWCRSRGQPGTTRLPPNAGSTDFGSGLRADSSSFKPPRPWGP